VGIVESLRAKQLDMAQLSPLPYILAKLFIPHLSSLISHLSSHFLREGSIAENPLTPQEGFITMPTEPGLGVKLDRKAVERYRVQ
jgi:L-alanine-DL-glutamate epimerase-like enolase superfamily enzyme